MDYGRVLEDVTTIGGKLNTTLLGTYTQKKKKNRPDAERSCGNAIESRSALFFFWPVVITVS